METKKSILTMMLENGEITNPFLKRMMANREKMATNTNINRKELLMNSPLMKRLKERAELRAKELAKAKEVANETLNVEPTKKEE